MPTIRNLQLIFKLIERSTTLSVVSDFLKSKGLPHSAGSWAEMYDKRIEPVINEGRLTVNDLTELLRSVEEYGQQHVFLFRIKREAATKLMDRQRIENVLIALKIEHLLNTPDLFEFPEQPTFVDVRWSRVVNKDFELVIKEVQTREAFEFVNVTSSGETLQRNYRRVLERTVNLLTLKSNGKLEIRLNSRRGPSNYSEDLKYFAERVSPFLGINLFSPISLSKAKNRLWADRAELSGKIRYADVVVTNDEDVSLRAYGNELNVNVISSKPAESSVDSFLASNGYCESSNIWFVKGDPRPDRDVHVVLHGQANEFSVPTNCSQSDYEYVLSEIEALNG